MNQRSAYLSYNTTGSPSFVLPVQSELKLYGPPRSVPVLLYTAYFKFTACTKFEVPAAPVGSGGLALPVVPCQFTIGEDNAFVPILDCVMGSTTNCSGFLYCGCGFLLILISSFSESSISTSFATGISLNGLETAK